MTTVGQVRTRAAALREQLGFPVLDGDGHVIEPMPLFVEFVRDHGRGDLVDALPFLTRRGDDPQPDLSADDRRRAGIYPAFWSVPAEADYYATVSSPRRYHDRLPEAGIDFSVLYPTIGLSFPQILVDDHRVSICRLYNEFMAEQYRPYRDRFTVAAAIPMHTPAEAIAALEHAKGLGAKVALIPSFVRRPMPGQPWPPEDPLATHRNPVFTSTGWVDTYGIDSAHDYDPVWAKAIELGFPLAAHSHAIGFSDRSSVSVYMFNQIGSFSTAGSNLAKSLFFGGVAHRFPDLRLALLEGGASEGVRLFTSFVSVWKKRGRPGIGRLDPSNIDRELLGRLLAEADPRTARHDPEAFLGVTGLSAGPHDEFAAAHVTSVEDIRDQWCNCFAWGCEGDDPLVGLAFDPKVTPLGARVPAIFGSDIGHWDVPEFDCPLEEAYELVEDGILDEASLRDFLFVNPVRFYGSPNPDFFAGTSIEGPARAELRR
jgi:predicted TIM-barrel fold metal-dependent hydrolase